MRSRETSNFGRVCVTPTSDEAGHRTFQQRRGKRLAGRPTRRCERRRRWRAAGPWRGLQEISSASFGPTGGRGRPIRHRLGHPRLRDQANYTGCPLMPRNSAVRPMSVRYRRPRYRRTATTRRLRATLPRFADPESSAMTSTMYGCSVRHVLRHHWFRRTCRSCSCADGQPMVSTHLRWHWRDVRSRSVTQFRRGEFDRRQVIRAVGYRNRSTFTCHSRPRPSLTADGTSAAPAD